MRTIEEIDKEIERLYAEKEKLQKKKEFKSIQNAITAYNEKYDEGLVIMHKIEIKAEDFPSNFPCNIYEEFRIGE